jgi:hypothetical protein
VNGTVLGDTRPKVYQKTVSLFCCMGCQDLLTLNGEKILDPDCCFDVVPDGVNLGLFARGRSNASSMTDGIVLSTWDFIPTSRRTKAKKSLFAFLR